MVQDEFYSFDEFYEKNKKEPAEVKRLISEGAIQVFREADQVKLKPAPEVGDTKKKKTRRRFNNDESQYYIACCQKFREECFTVISLAGFMTIACLLMCAMRPKADEVLFHIATLFLALAAISFIASFFFALVANAFFGRFIVLSSQPTRLGDKKNLLSFVTNGYTHKQGAKSLCMIGIDNLVVFLLFHLLSQNRIMALVWFIMAGGLVLAVYWYMRYIKKSFALRTPRKAFLFLEEDVSNIFPGVFPKDREEKTDVDDKITLSSLSAIMHNSSTKVRREAVKALGRLGTPDTMNALVSALGDGAPEVKAQAISVLGGTEEKSVRDSIKCLFYDESPEVRAAVSEALGYLSDEDSLDLLLMSLEDESPEVRGTAAEALGRLGKRKTIKHLVTKMKDSDWFVRHKTTIALGKMKSDLSIEAIEQLLHALSDEHEYVCLAAEHIVRKIAEDMAKDDPLYMEVIEALNRKGIQIPTATKAKEQEKVEDKTTVVETGSTKSDSSSPQSENQDKENTAPQATDAAKSEEKTQKLTDTPASESKTATEAPKENSQDVKPNQEKSEKDESLNPPNHT